MWRWPNFTPEEIACKGSGDVLINERALDALQQARTSLRRPVAILSAYRSPIHNARVGGAPRSRHLFGDAFDIRRAGHDDQALYDALLDAGFTGFGFYSTFIHADLWKKRQWGKKWAVS